jgi:hypothetical protein
MNVSPSRTDSIRVRRHLIWLMLGLASCTAPSSPSSSSAGEASFVAEDSAVALQPASASLGPQDGPESPGRPQRFITDFRARTNYKPRVVVKTLGAPQSIAIPESDQLQSDKMAWSFSASDGGTLTIRIPEGTLEGILGRETPEGAVVLVKGVDEPGTVEVTVRERNEMGALLVDRWEWNSLPVSERNSVRLVQREDRHWGLVVVHQGKKVEFEVRRNR